MSRVLSLLAKSALLIQLAAISSGSLCAQPAPASSSPAAAMPEPFVTGAGDQKQSANSLPILESATPPPLGQSAAAPSQDKNKNPQDQIVWSQVHVDGPYVALTFDDGPHAVLTPQLLDILAQRHIHATFFVVGQMVQEHPEIVRRAMQEGHEIADHSWSHPNLAKMNDDAVKSEILRTREAIMAATGQPVTLFRPPYGSLTTLQRHWINKDLGFKIILWDVDPLDWKRPGSAVVAERIIKGTREGSIVLSHDIHAGTVAAMPETLDALIKKGFKFVTVSQLIGMQTPETASNATPASSVRDSDKKQNKLKSETTKKVSSSRKASRLRNASLPLRITGQPEDPQTTLALRPFNDGSF